MEGPDFPDVESAFLGIIVFAVVSAMVGLFSVVALFVALLRKERPKICEGKQEAGEI